MDEQQDRTKGRQAAGGGPAFRAVSRFMAVPRFIVASLILASIAINCANVVGRYVFFSPIVWAEEVMIFIMVWCVFIGAVLVTWDGRHLRMDLLANSIPDLWRMVVNFIATAGFLVLAGLVVTQSWQVVSLFGQLGQKSTTAGVPMIIPHSAVLIGFGLMFICVAVRFRAYVTGSFGSEAEDVARQYAADDDGEETE